MLQANGKEKILGAITENSQVLYQVKITNVLAVFSSGKMSAGRQWNIVRVL